MGNAAGAVTRSQYHRFFFFACLKSRLWRESFDTPEAIVVGVKTLFDEYDAATLERVWQSLLKRHNQVLRTLGGDDFEVEHGGIFPSQINGFLSLL